MRQTHGGSIVRWVLMLPVGVGIILCTVWAVGFHGISVYGERVVDRGVAVAENCEFGGPFHARGFGMWSTCEAEVTWADGTVESREFLRSQLTDADLGRPVEVVERESFRGRGNAPDYEVYRADFLPSSAWGYLLYAPIGLGGALCLVAGHRIWSHLKATTKRPADPARHPR
ncbi:hypothetical protein GIY23_18865 [Allosaccharopolyspora coralli]|uniref:DUF3592 domain-containing protein n=1 Tax=Allosaccharopolyspora coralli TaxID=2665642 RepID=A0A5Q3Q9R8_9PSEU|nr:DUF6346 domain-containing protein [Allosaccharopolyspora coralli]QGK71308.1 hypothetical protein GIY23_18865 [Allosaccharopolyspora coralli]